MRSPDYVQDSGTHFEFGWEAEDLRVVVNRIRERPNGDVMAYVSVTSADGKRRLLPKRKADIGISDGRWKLARDMNKRAPDVDMRLCEDLIEYICDVVLEKRNAGDSPISFADIEVTEHDPWLFFPWLYWNEPTVLYGRGGSFKSYLAVYIAVLLAMSGHHVLYVDYETNRNEWATRVARVCKGLSIDPPALFLHYVYRKRRLADEVEEIQRFVHETEAGVVIIDSAVPASGGAVVDVAATMDFFTALRTLERTVLIVGHENKRDELMGNEMWRNSVRLAYQVRAGTSTPPEVGVFQMKTNVSEKIKPFGYRVQFHSQNPPRYTPGDWVRFDDSDISDSPDFQDRLPMEERIEKFLLREGKSLVKDIAFACETSPDAIRSVLSRMFKKGKVRKAGDHWYVPAPDGTYRDVPEVKHDSEPF